MVVNLFKFWSLQSLFTPIPDGESVAEADNRERFLWAFFQTQFAVQSLLKNSQGFRV